MAAPPLDDGWELTGKTLGEFRHSCEKFLKLCQMQAAPVALWLDRATLVVTAAPVTKSVGGRRATMRN